MGQVKALAFTCPMLFSNFYAPHTPPPSICTENFENSPFFLCENMHKC